MYANGMHSENIVSRIRDLFPDVPIRHGTIFKILRENEPIKTDQVRTQIFSQEEKILIEKGPSCDSWRLWKKHGGAKHPHRQGDTVGNFNKNYYSHGE